MIQKNNDLQNIHIQFRHKTGGKTWTPKKQFGLKTNQASFLPRKSQQP
jgi:hypothetical protein